LGLTFLASLGLNIPQEVSRNDSKNKIGKIGFIKLGPAIFFFQYVVRYKYQMNLTLIQLLH